MSEEKRKPVDMIDTVVKKIKTEHDSGMISTEEISGSTKDPAIIHMIKLRGILEKEIQSEISFAKEDMEEIEDRIFRTRLYLTKVRQGVVSDYYRQSNKVNTGKLQRPLHPAVQKLLPGKEPCRKLLRNKKTAEVRKCLSEPGPSGISSSLSKSDQDEEVNVTDIEEDLSFDKPSLSATLSSFGTSETPDSSVLHSSNNLVSVKVEVSETEAENKIESTCSKSVKVPRYVPPNAFGIPVTKLNEPRGNVTKQKVRLMVGNVSKWLGSHAPDATHKWTVYLKSSNFSDLSRLVSKVKYYLHPSYKPNDIVQITSAPFKLTRRGWGEFPLRMQLYFFDPNDKPVDIVHTLKLDRTYTGMETFGCETLIDVWLHISEKENSFNILNEEMKFDGISCLNTTKEVDLTSKEKSIENDLLDWLNPMDSSIIEEFASSYLNKNPDLNNITDEVGPAYEKENKCSLDLKSENDSEVKTTLLDKSEKSDPLDCEERNSLFEELSGKGKLMGDHLLNQSLSKDSLNGLLSPCQAHGLDEPPADVLSKEVCDKIESSLSTAHMKTLNMEYLKVQPSESIHLAQVTEMNSENCIENSECDVIESFDNEVVIEDEVEEHFNDFQTEVVLETEDMDSTDDKTMPESLPLSKDLKMPPLQGFHKTLSTPLAEQNARVGNKPVYQIIFPNHSKDIKVDLSKTQIINPKLMLQPKTTVHSVSNVGIQKSELAFKPLVSSQGNVACTGNTPKKVLILPGNKLVLVPSTMNGVRKVANNIVSQAQGLIKKINVTLDKESKPHKNSVGNSGRRVINKALIGEPQLVPKRGVIKTRELAGSRQKLMPILSVQVDQTCSRLTTKGMNNLPSSTNPCLIKSNKANTLNCIQSVLKPCLSAAPSQSVHLAKSSVYGQTQASHQVKVIPKNIMSNVLPLSPQASMDYVKTLTVKRHSTESNQTSASPIKGTVNLSSIQEIDYGRCPSESVENAVRWLMDCHPLVDQLVSNENYRVLHPYAAPTLQIFTSWPIPKQRAAEWLRAKTIVRLLPKVCPNLKPWRMIDVIRWARFRGYTPIPAVKDCVPDQDVKVVMKYTPPINVNELIKLSDELNSKEEIDILNVKFNQIIPGTKEEDTSEEEEGEDEGGLVKWISRNIEGLSSRGALVLLSAFHSFADDLIRRSLEHSWSRHNYRSPGVIERVDVEGALLSREQFDLFTNAGLGVPSGTARGAFS